MATKAELNAEQHKTVRLQGFDLSCFRSISQFEDDDTQNYLVLQLVYKYFEKNCNSEYTSAWKSKRFFDESIKPTAGSYNSLAVNTKSKNFKKLLKTR